ncbi:MAG: hypothetical protein ACTHU0_10325 [Kofleriaceae bacterium]
MLDATGRPLYLDAETDYIEFRKAVGNVPGLYRLDQCDEDGVEIEGAPPAYVSIDLTRNASTSSDGDANPLVIIEHMFAIHADVMKTMATQQASLMAASAEILRAPFRPPPPPAPVSAKGQADTEDEDEDEDIHGVDEDETAPDPWAAWRPLIKMAEPHLPKLGEFLYHQFVAFMTKTATTAQAGPSASAGAGASASPNSPARAAAGTSAREATTTSSTTQVANAVPTATAHGTPRTQTPPSSAENVRAHSSHAPRMEAAGYEPDAEGADSAPIPTADASSMSTQPATSPESGAATNVETNTGSSDAPPVSDALAVAVAPSPASAATRNATPLPTPAQMAHLAAIRERLSARECAIAENAIARMAPDLLARWLAELCSLSVDDAAHAIRAMIGRLRSTSIPERR